MIIPDPFQMCRSFTQATSSFILATERSAWALGLGWIIFAAEFGYAAPIYNFLTLKVWTYLRKEYNKTK
jgi:ABC-type multidrug transport system permease subunit